MNELCERMPCWIEYTGANLHVLPLQRLDVNDIVLGERRRERLPACWLVCDFEIRMSTVPRHTTIHTVNTPFPSFWSTTLPCS